MKKLRNNKIRKLLAFMVALALMVSCMPSAYTISASEAFGDGTEDIFTDGEITSEPAAEESTPDVSSADQEETEQAQQSTLTYENDSVKVTAEALEDGALPQNTALKADSVNENSSVSYDTVSQKLSAAATDKGSSLRGFFAYDVYFADGDGNRVEPNGRVRVTFEYKTPAAPELTDAASTSVTVEKLHYNSSTGDTDVNTLQANEDLKVLNVNEGKQIQTLQVETGNAAVFAVMWDSPETADVEAEAVSGNEDEVPIASEELTDGMDISDEPEQDAAETPAAENPEVTPDAEPSEAPAENPDAEPTEAPAEDPDVVEEPAEDIASPEDVPAADENGETSLIEVLGDDTNLRVSPSIEAEVLATVNAGTQLTLLDTVTAEDGATWYKVSWEGTEAYIRSDMAQVVDSSDEAEEPEDVQEEEIQPEITRYDYKSDEVNVKVTLTDPADLPDNAELSVTPVELSQEAEDQITEEAIKEKKAIEKIHSYDIKFLVDGEEVQPGASVKVSVSLNDEKKIKDADVYHVDKNDNVENMDGSVAKNGDVEFETTHFSTYVIVQKGNNTIHVTVKYCDKDGNEIYAADSNKELSVGGRLKLKELANWNVTKVVVNPNSGNSSKVYTSEDTDVETSIELAESATVTAYYEATTGTKTGAPIFFDYTIKVKTGTNTVDSINNSKNYDSNDSRKKLTAGGYKPGASDSDNYSQFTYKWNDKTLSSDSKIPNAWTEYQKGGVIKGLLSGVEDTTVKFNYADPGFFKQEDLSVKDKDKDKVYLRKVYKNYVLNFDRTGDTYTLSTVQDGNKNQVATAGDSFFPLDSVGYQSNKNVEDIKSNSANKSDKTSHNYFFGLRYDIKFKLGDYIGDLKYKFTGDDDLWVVLDGKTVVIDLGGIHNAASDEVDLWQYLLKKGQKKADLKDAEDQKNAEHTLTVLYMERGAGASNCKMQFTLPNATISQVTTDPLGTLELQKVNSNKDQGVNGARFTLYGDSACTNEIETAESTKVDNVDGKVIFRSKLREGTYYLKETQAPDGYVRSTEIWTVEVAKKSDTEVSVTLKDGSGNSVENNKIVNQTKQEFIDSNMEYNKTVTVDEWDKRTYNINITASSTSSNKIPTTKKVVADVMLVLDVSGSMKYPAGKSIGKNSQQLRNSLNKEKEYYLRSSNEDDENNDYMTMRFDNDRSDWYVGKYQASYYSRYYVYSSNITRLQALKQSVNQFIKDIAAKSENSKIGIVTFSRSGKSNNLKSPFDKLQNAKTAESYLQGWVNSLSADGGTQPGPALKKAKNMLDLEANDKYPKYTILFTDGEPTGASTEWSPTVQKEAEEAANGTDGLKTAGYTVYTIGFALSKRAEAFLAGGTVNDVNYPGIASKDCAFIASDATKLGKIFQDIQSSITQDTAITGATITDVIDPRFVIVNDNGDPISNEDLKKGSIILNNNGGVVSLDEKGNQVITWNDQTIPNKNNPDPYNRKWTRTITVKAKNDYIGGNNVPTNVAQDSKISTGYGDAILPQPTVNVKADLTVDNLEKVIFLGDPTPTADLPDSMLSSILKKSKNYVYNETTKKLESVPVTKKDLTCSWAKDETFGTDNLTDLKSMAGEHPTENPTRYYLKVTYNAGEPTETVDTKPGSTENTGGHIAGGKTHTVTAINSDTKNYPSKEYGVYTIHIIKGQIQITKKLEDVAKKDGTFTFNVYNKENELIKTVDAKVSKNEKDAKFTVGNDESTTVIIAGLARGEYTVEEVSKDGYQLVSATSDSEVTNCKSEEGNDITFSIGTDNTTEHKDALKALEAEDLKKGNDYYANYAGPGCVGKVDYTNKEIVADVDFVKVDLNNHNTKIDGAEFALYKAKVNNDESTWSKDGDAIATARSANGGEFRFKDLAPGKYLMVETKATSEYALPTNPWKITVEENGKVTVNKNDGITEVGSSNNKYLIENTKLYSLPNSGGPGTYGFTISGVAILATALLLFINNKRREEEAKRS